MDTRREFLDPKAGLLAATTTSVAWAVGIPIVGAILVGALTFVTKASLGVLFVRTSLAGRTVPDREGVGATKAVLPVRERSQEDRWVRRSELAVDSIERLASSFRTGPLSAHLAGVTEQAREALGEIRDLAGQASTAKDAARHLDASRLAAEEARLTAKLQLDVDPPLAGDIQRSLGAVRDQLAILRRLEQARKTLLARIEASSLGLQHLAAQISELTALAGEHTASEEGVWLSELTQQLDALRSGMAEAAALSRRALGTFEPERRG